MDNKELKIKHVFNPIIKTLLGFLIFYSILHWVFLEYFYSFEIAENYFFDLVPIILVIILNIFVFSPRFNLIKLKDPIVEDVKFPKMLKFLNILNKILNNPEYIKRRQRQALFQIFVILNLFLIFTIVNLQVYINKNFSKVTVLNSFSEIDLYPTTKYYKVNNYFIDFHCSPYFKITGSVIDYEKYMLSKNYFVNVGVPIFPIYYKSKDTLNRNSYLGWIFNEDLREFDNLVLESKQNHIKNKEDKYFLDFYNKPLPFKQIKNDQYFIKVYESSSDFEFYYDLIKSYDNYPNNKNLFIFKNSTFEARTGDNLFWFITFFSLLLLFIIIGYFTIDLDMNKIERLEKGESVLKINIPPFLLKLLSTFKK